MNSSVKIIVALIVVVAVALALFLLRPKPDRQSGAADENAVQIAIGGKNFTEQVLLCRMFTQLVDADPRFRAEARANLGGTMICFNALKGGSLDLYAEYTGTGLVNILDRPALSDPDEAYDAVKQAFAEKWDLVWLEPLGFNNTYALTMRREHAEELGIETVGDLAEYLRANPDADLTAAFDGEFHARPDGYKGLIEHYDFEFPAKPKQMDAGIMYRACAEGQADVISAFATDGRIAAFDLKVLKDDLGFFPPYYAAPLVRRDTLEENPGLRETLNQLAGRLSNDKMRELNYRVDEEGVRAERVAHEYLVEEGLVAQNDAVR